ncbi:MAG: hypothetical protein ACREGH_02895 [Minisyncoccia bacterium]
MNRADELHVKIQTPESVIWEGEAQSVSSENSLGPFDILPEHANIVSLIEHKPIIVITSSGKQEFTFERAVISLRDNRVSVLGDITSQKGN